VTYQGACHCGAVSFAVDDTPKWLTRCNCSACRRFGALWFHTRPAHFTLTAAKDATIAYVWGDKLLAFQSCRSCGCTTHFSPLEASGGMAVNMNMADPQSIKDIPIRHFDGADTWAFTD